MNDTSTNTAALAAQPSTAEAAAAGTPTPSPAPGGAPTEKPDPYPRRYQWTLVDTKGIREFPGWLHGEPEIWAYTDKITYDAGDEVQLRAHTNCEKFSVHIYRESNTPQTVLRKEGIRGIHQHTPDDASIKGCGWKPAFSFKTHDWQPGVYIIVLNATDTQGKTAQGEHFVVIRSRRPGSTSKLCVILTTCTYTAYNDWGGANHYRSIRDGIATDTMEPKLSLNRPWGRGFVVRPAEAPDVLESTTPPPFWKPSYPEVLWPLANNYSRHYVEGYSTYAARFIRWAEANGYTLEVATQYDLHLKPDSFKDYTCLIVLGHDEYWSWEMRDTIDHFVNEGGHIARFAGNFVWQIRLEDGGQTQVCYKDADKDPVADRTRTTISWDAKITTRPSPQTFGLRAEGYCRYGTTTPRSSGGFTVYRPWHWALANTDLYYGDVFGRAPVNVFGFEVDGLDYRIANGLPQPTGLDNPPEGIQIIAMALSAFSEIDRWNGTVMMNSALRPGRRRRKDSDYFKAGARPTEPGGETIGAVGAGMIAYFERQKGSVFNAGSPTWVRGLEMGDFFTQQITKNVLDRFGDLG